MLVRGESFGGEDDGEGFLEPAENWDMNESTGEKARGQRSHQQKRLRVGVAWNGRDGPGCVWGVGRDGSCPALSTAAHSVTLCAEVDQDRA